MICLLQQAQQRSHPAQVSPGEEGDEDLMVTKMLIGQAIGWSAAYLSLVSKNVKIEMNRKKITGKRDRHSTTVEENEKRHRRR